MLSEMHLLGWGQSFSHFYGLEQMIESSDIVKILTQDEEKMIEIMQSHLTLQDQFRKLTIHVETCYARIANLEHILANKVLS